MSFSSVVLLSLLTKGSEYDYLDRKVIIQNQFSILLHFFHVQFLLETVFDTYMHALHNR